MPSGDGPHGWRASAWRFLLAGGANTALTAALLAALSMIIDPRVAYTVVFVFGIAISTYLASRYVYGISMSRRALGAYVTMYVAVYAVGLVVVNALKATDLPSWSSAGVVLVTAPLTFLGGRAIVLALHRSRNPSSARSSEEA